MKSWFTRFKISAALDTGKVLPPALQRRLQRSEELRHYRAACRALDGTLKDSAPAPAAPVGLHRSIMRAVRKAESSTATQTVPLQLRWLAASVLAVAVLFGAWRIANLPANPNELTLAAAGTALDLSQQAAQTVPTAVVAPLSDEWQRVNRDLEKTTEFLLASLP